MLIQMLCYSKGLSGCEAAQKWSKWLSSFIWEALESTAVAMQLGRNFTKWYKILSLSHPLRLPFTHVLWHRFYRVLPLWVALPTSLIPLVHICIGDLLCLGKRCGILSFFGLKNVGYLCYILANHISNRTNSINLDTGGKWVPRLIASHHCTILIRW